ncbi:hypothetical protein AGMMS50233_05740 [Endomicrobiia bacterium]|nr:hypothetical protein AGMMS50233_05740 [Endomicrobiia bacterium]
MVKTKLLISFISFGLMLSSCDQKNARLVNRRVATPEKIEEIKEAERIKVEVIKEAQRARAKTQ